MMKFVNRRILAQACLVVTAAAIFLPWVSDTGNNDGSLLGTQVNAGRVIFIAALVTVVLIQVRWRPAWIGAGFVVAVNGRDILDLLGSQTADIGLGLWVSTLTALLATVLLVREMFSSVSRVPADDDI